MFNNFIRTNLRALNENSIINNVFLVIQGNIRIPSVKNIIFGNLELFTNGNFVDPKPDFYDGAYLIQINRSIREKLRLYITPLIQ